MSANLIDALRAARCCVKDGSAVAQQIDAALAQAEAQGHVATVAEVHISRYTLEWNGNPLPEGTKLYTEPQPAAPAVPADLPDVEDMAHNAVQELLSYGVSHDVVQRWMRSIADKTVAAMLAAAQDAPTLMCPACKADRLKEPCKGNGPCPMVGVPQSAAPEVK